MPTAKATGSVPGRRPYCWWPPKCNGTSGVPARKTRAPIPAGPWNLCAERLIAATPSAEMDRPLADDLDGVGVQRHASVVCQGGQFGYRLEHARIVVAEHYA